MWIYNTNNFVLNIFFPMFPITCNLPCGNSNLWLKDCDGKFLEVEIYCFGHLWVTLHVIANEIYPCNKGVLLCQVFVWQKKTLNRPFLFLGPVFNGPFSWPFWFFLPTYWVFAKIRNKFSIHFQLDFANMYTIVVQ
jgi:hypothetical protein